MKPTISAKRYKGKGRYEAEATQANRTPFLTDYDRIIFSNSFRRLSKKTQVHPLSKNDHVHNRLTHSLEVASVGRTLGLGVGQYMQETLEDFSHSPYEVAAIVQSACLAHDIGNPPFGHAGEEIIKEWFVTHQHTALMEEISPEQRADFFCFDGNAQSLRIVTQLENHPYEGGMRLTLSTQAAMIKYPWEAHDVRSKGKKFSYFQSEKAIARAIFEEFGLEEEGVFVRHPFSYLMEAADDICYALLDIKDAVELGMLEAGGLGDIFLPLCGEKTYYETLSHQGMSDFQKVSRLCAFAIGRLSSHAIETFIAQKLYIPRAHGKDLISLFSDQGLQEGLARAKALGHAYIFNEPRKIELELGAYRTIGILLEDLIGAAHALHVSQKTFKTERALTLMGNDAPQPSWSLYEKYQAVLDYIVGMTDNYATRLAGQLAGLGR